MLESTLTSLGFNLKDCGKYWTSNAAFRDGDNPAALQIFKDTGVWIDYARDAKARSVEELVALCGGTINTNQLRSTDSTEKEEKMAFAKIYDQSILKRLLPHYSFYNKRGISDKTLKLYRGGLATSGKMYQRYVLPVFNSVGRIHGFTGRDMLDKVGRPKWKILGDKKNFIYPYYMIDENENRTMDESAVDFSKDVFIIESNGDSLSMTEHGRANHFVSFGVKLSASLLSKLLELHPRNIYISYNDDSEKKHAGLRGALSAAISLKEHFSKKKIHIVMPEKKDFGEMDAADYKKFDSKVSKSRAWEDIENMTTDFLKKYPAEKKYHDIFK